ncbi:hypothetical protein Poli38472_001746 [Pythium oligandrum]|uniref:FAD-binding PCMH-type domain-containing protein n=1 Tax=Pythium oligandrum TaxID=41045 RepID=A0A8K1CVS8_PYTOL|nr:hypothetical protein Poli38472_001746 [Pythium oligandrum]|eukprot:TMW69590.1 hypothetical protein Poli38472_001746 [Pythium oligandrum]
MKTLLWCLAALAALVPGISATPGHRWLADNKLDLYQSCLGTNRPVTADLFFTPTSSAYLDFATGTNARIDRHPAAVFFAQNEHDVVVALECALLVGLTPVARSGGHSYETLSSIDGGVVIDLASMNNVTVISRNDTAQTGVASVQGGARLGQVYKEIYRQGGYNFNAGTCPGVGIGGHISGGGYGMVSRHYGMAADSTVGLRVALYNGTVVEATATENSDLFWALRGGGSGSFGIVTEFRIQLHKVPQSTMFVIYYDNTVTSQLIRAWMDYFPTADSRITTQVNVDKDGTTFRGQFIGPMWELNELLDASGMLSHGGIKYDVRTDKCTSLGTKAFMWGDNCNNLDVLNTEVHPRSNSKSYSKMKSAYASKKLPDDGIRLVIDQVNKAPASSWIQFEAFGGKFATQPLSYTPWGGRDAVFSVQLYIAGNKGDPASSPNRNWIRDFATALQPYMNGRSYQNYCDLEIGPNYGEVYWGKDNFQRLKQVKARYDPQNIFHNEQSVPLP